MLYRLEEATYPDTKEYDLSKIKFTHVKNDHYEGDEPYLIVDGKKYRIRAEMLLLNDEGKIFVNTNTTKIRGGMKYSLPGGGIEPNETIEQAAARETEEEALLVPKNVKYSGYHYRLLYPNKNTPENIMQYDGVLCFICTGEYDKKYTKYVKQQDRTSLAEKGSWVDPKDIDTLSPVHKKVIDAVLRKSKLIMHKSLGYELDETNSYIRSLVSIKEFNEFLNNNFDYGYVYDYQLGKPIRSKSIDFDKYKTVDVETFAKYRIGTCWDYTNYEAFVFNKKFQYKNISKGKLKNNTFSTYYIQFESADGKNPSHTWLGYMKNDKVYSFESSWKSHQGIKEFNTEKEMVEYYWKEHKEFSNKTSKTDKGFVCKFPPLVFSLGVHKEELTVEEFMNYIYKHGCIIKSDFKEYTVNKVFKNLTEDIDTTFLDTEYEI